MIPFVTFGFGLGFFYILFHGFTLFHLLHNIHLFHQGPRSHIDRCSSAMDENEVLDSLYTAERQEGVCVCVCVTVVQAQLAHTYSSWQLLIRLETSVYVNRQEVLCSFLKDTLFQVGKGGERATNDCEDNLKVVEWIQWLELDYDRKY